MPEELESTKGICRPSPGIPASGGVQGKKYLLTIAIDKYDGSNGYCALKYPVSNAVALAAELEKSYGFTVEAINDHECTAENIKDKIIDIIYEIGKEGQLIVFFTGHGAAVSDSGYWIPINSKDKIEKNCSVLAILESLVGGCAQVLLLIDCCFSGMAADAAYPIELFKKEGLQKSVFSVITVGSKYEVAPDKSIFFEALLNILRYNNIHSFNDLALQLEKQLEYRGAKTNIITHSTVTHFKQNFLLKRQDQVSHDLARSFLELNFSKQNNVDGATTFNMTYLRGSRECGHDIFLYRYFSKNDRKAFPAFDYPVHKISFGGEGNSPSYSMWEKLSVTLGIPNTDPDNIIKAIVNILQHNNFLLIARIKGSCVESEMEKALREFWQKLFSYAEKNEKEVNDFAHGVYFFIWDVRGNTDEVCNIITEEKFDQLVLDTNAKLLALPPIKEVVKSDFVTWYNIARKNYEALPKDERFGALKFDILQPPLTVMNVIAQIEEVFDKREVFSKLFAINKFSYND